MYRASGFVAWFLLVAPMAFGQAEGDGATAPAPATADPSAQQQLTITGAEMLDQGREYRRQIEAITMQIQVQADQAKADKDVIRLNCLLDKLTQVKVNGNIMDQALQSLQDAVSRQDQSAQLHEYTRITIINQKAQVLRTEADACIGAETNYVGPTKVVGESPSGLQSTIDQPPAVAPTVAVVDRLPVSSPFK